MATEPSKGLLIAILVISAANLLVSAVQTGIMIRQPAPNSSALSSVSLPSKYTDALLAQLATRVTEPYNRGDTDAVYNIMDDLAKTQTSREKFAQEIATLKDLVGNVDSASYAGFEMLPRQAGIQLYRLNYGVKLSGGKVQTGLMQITVLDRPAQPGIVGFFINGRSQ